MMWRLAWATVGQDTRQEMVELAREGEAILRAMGVPAPQPSALTLRADSSGDVVSDWTDSYDAATSSGAMAPPVSVLWAGQHWADPRSDAIIMRLAQGTPPAWDTLVARANTLDPPAGANRNNLLGSLDWWAARGPSLQRGNEPQQAADRYARAWWSENLSRWHARGATPPTPQTPPGATPPTPQGDSGGGGGMVLAGLALAAAVVMGKRRRGR